MKLDLVQVGVARWFAAAQRQATTQGLIHISCNIRKCRRDGCCSGPLLFIDANGDRKLAPPLPSTTVDDEIMPICHACLTARTLREIDERISALLDENEDHAVPVAERTRTLAARRWRSIDPGYAR